MLVDLERTKKIQDQILKQDLFEDPRLLIAAILGVVATMLTV